MCAGCGRIDAGHFLRAPQEVHLRFPAGKCAPRECLGECTLPPKERAAFKEIWVICTAQGHWHSLLHAKKEQSCTGEPTWAGVGCQCLLVGDSQASIVFHRNLEGFPLFCEFVGKCHTFFFKINFLVSDCDDVSAEV